MSLGETAGQNSANSGHLPFSIGIAVSAVLSSPKDFRQFCQPNARTRCTMLSRAATTVRRELTDMSYR